MQEGRRKAERRTRAEEALATGPARGVRRRAGRTSSPAASGSASPWPGPWSTGPRCCCSTSRSARSTSSCAARCRSSSRQIQRDVGITFVFVTHDQEEALTMSDRIAVFNDGRIEQVGTPGRALRAARPAAFVAGFVGTSNLLERRGRPSSCSARDGTFARPAREAARRTRPAAPVDPDERRAPGHASREVVYLGPSHPLRRRARRRRPRSTVLAAEHRTRVDRRRRSTASRPSLRRGASLAPRLTDRPLSGRDQPRHRGDSHEHDARDRALGARSASRRWPLAAPAAARRRRRRHAAPRAAGGFTPPDVPMQQSLGDDGGRRSTSWPGRLRRGRLATTRRSTG